MSVEALALSETRRAASAVYRAVSNSGAVGSARDVGRPIRSSTVWVELSEGRDWQRLREFVRRHHARTIFTEISSPKHNILVDISQKALHEKITISRKDRLHA